MLSVEDKRKLIESTEGYWSLYILDQRSIGGFKGYKSIEEKIQRYLAKLKKELNLNILAISPKWSRLNIDHAKSVIIEIAKSSIAYDDILITEKECKYLADKFLADFSTDAVYVTNGFLEDYHPLHSGLDFSIAGTPVEGDAVVEETNGKGYLFSSAVIAFDTQNIGIFCKCESD